MLPVPSQSQRNLAALAHASGIFLPLLGPFAVCLFSRDRFVRFHALHALVGALLLNLVLFTFGAISITISVVGLYRHYQEGWENFSIWQILIKSAITWIVLALIGVANTVMNVVQAFGALNGKTPIRGLTTTLVRRLLGKEELKAA